MQGVIYEDQLRDKISLEKSFQEILSRESASWTQKVRPSGSQMGIVKPGFSIDLPKGGRVLFEGWSTSKGRSRMAQLSLSRTSLLSKRICSLRRGILDL